MQKNSKGKKPKKKNISKITKIPISTKILQTVPKSSNNGKNIFLNINLDLYLNINIMNPL